jgi:hypothetical protein
MPATIEIGTIHWRQRKRGQWLRAGWLESVGKWAGCWSDVVSKLKTLKKRSSGQGNETR